MKRHTQHQGPIDECCSSLKSPRLNLEISQSRNRSGPGSSRVRFDGHTDVSGPVSVQVMTTLVPASEMGDAEKDAIWYPKASVRETIMRAELQAKGFAKRRIVDAKAQNYAETLTTTYARCAFEEMYHEQVSEHCAQSLALSEVEHKGDSTRGLEKIASPLMGQDILRRRKETIDSVLLAQFVLRCGHPASQEQDEVLRGVSEEHSKGLRRYANAMGMADAVSAVLEYQACMPVTKNLPQAIISEISPITDMPPVFKADPAYTHELGQPGAKRSLG
jgi:hypothetical protein